MGVGMNFPRGITTEQYHNLLSTVNTMPNTDSYFMLKQVKLAFDSETLCCIVYDSRITANSCVDINFYTPYDMRATNLRGNTVDGAVEIICDVLPESDEVDENGNTVITANIFLSNPVIEEVS